jgi:hypothetical protein
VAISPIITHQEYLNKEDSIMYYLHVANPWYTIPLHWSTANTRCHLQVIGSSVNSWLFIDSVVTAVADS